MELDEEMKLNSICPAVKKFFEQKYDPMNFSSNDQNLMKEFLLDIYKETKNGSIFQKLVDIWLVNPILKEIKVRTNAGYTNMSYSINTLLGDAVLIVYQLEDLLNKENELTVALMNQRNVLIIIRDQNFDLIDYLYLKLSDKKGIFFNFYFLKY